MNCNQVECFSELERSKTMMKTNHNVKQLYKRCLKKPFKKKKDRTKECAYKI